MRTRTWTAALGVGAALLAAGCGQEDVFSLEPGTCFQDVAAVSEEGGGEVAEVPVVDCDEPHDNEVFATFDLAHEEFPGDTAVREAADDGCQQRFEDYVGTDYPTSRFVSSHLVPTERTWAGQGDREVVCFLYDMDLQKLEGSAEGSGQ